MGWCRQEIYNRGTSRPILRRRGATGRHNPQREDGRLHQTQAGQRASSVWLLAVSILYGVREGCRRYRSRQCVLGELRQTRVSVPRLMKFWMAGRAYRWGASDQRRRRHSLPVWLCSFVLHDRAVRTALGRREWDVEQFRQAIRTAQ